LPVWLKVERANSVQPAIRDVQLDEFQERFSDPNWLVIAGYAIIEGDTNEVPISFPRGRADLAP
jgi:hypothetical protein